MRLDDWRRDGTAITWRGHRVFTREGGRGDPVVLIHGFPTASWDWAPVWPAITARYRAITLDMLGFGFSAKPRPHAYSVLEQADLFDAVLAPLPRFHVVAHDYGVSVAQELLARDTGRIASLTLLNGGLFPETHRALPIQRLLASRLGPLLVHAMTFGGFAASMRRIWGGPLGRDELVAMWQLVTESDGLAVMPALLGYIAERRQLRARWVGALVAARVPARLIVGMVDPVSGAHMAARYRELVPHADVVELAGVGHYPQVEAPARVTEAVLDHLARHSQ